MIIQDGTRIRETFASEFLRTVERNVRTCETFRYELNMQDGVNISLSCVAAYASEYLAFVQDVSEELDKHGIALVRSAYYDEKTNKFFEHIDIVVNE